MSRMSVQCNKTSKSHIDSDGIKFKMAARSQGSATANQITAKAGL